MQAISRRMNWQQRGEQVAACLILITTVTAVLGGMEPNSMGMAPMVGGLVLLLLGQLRREPLTGPSLVLLLLNLRAPLKGDGRYLPEELSLSDVLMVLIAIAAAFRASRAFWDTFQTLFAPLVSTAGALAWATHQSWPFPAGILTARQSALVFGLCLCYSLAHLRHGLARAPDRQRGSRSLPTPLWMLCALVAGGLLVASGGIGSLIQVGIALLMVQLCGWMQQANGKAGTGGQGRGLLAALWATCAATALFLLTSPLDTVGWAGLQQRLSLLGCFFLTPFTRLEWFFHGVGFTNSSSWLCQEVRPGAPMIHADNVLAQVAADHGFITLLALGGLLLWMGRGIWVLSERVSDPVVMAGLIGALYVVMDLQVGSGWAQSSLIQILLGLQVGVLSLNQERKA